MGLVLQTINPVRVIHRDAVWFSLPGAPFITGSTVTDTGLKWIMPAWDASGY